jgi:hypothetical protein
MSQEIQKTVQDVARAIENLNRAFEKQVSTLKQADDRDQLDRWIKAAQAMLDSGHIYLTWAKHYADLADPERDDDGSFLDEGSPIAH